MPDNVGNMHNNPLNKWNDFFFFFKQDRCGYYVENRVQMERGWGVGGE